MAPVTDESEMEESSQPESEQVENNEKISKRSEEVEKDGSASEEKKEEEKESEEKQVYEKRVGQEVAQSAKKKQVNEKSINQGKENSAADDDKEEEEDEAPGEEEKQDDEEEKSDEEEETVQPGKDGSRPELEYKLDDDTEELGKIRPRTKKGRLLGTTKVGRWSNPIYVEPLEDVHVQSCSMPRKRSRDNERVMEKDKDKDKGRVEEKKKKKKNNNKNNDEGTTLTASLPLVIYRLFKPDEEISLIEHMIYYERKKGRNPRDDVNGFHEFMMRRGRLSSDISAQQLKNKMRGWWRNFKANKEKGRTKERTPHQSRVFELLGRLWEDKVQTLALEKKKNDDNYINKVDDPRDGGGAAKATAAAAAPASGGGGSGLFDFIRNISSSAGDAMDEEFVRQGLQMMDENQRRNLEKRWREIEVQKMKIAADRSSLFHDCIRDILRDFHFTN